MSLRSRIVPVCLLSSNKRAQVYRSYCGDFKRLCDVVRCCLVLDTPDDMINLVKVFKTRAIIRYLKLSHTLQKMLDPAHSTVAESSASPVRDYMASLWNTLLVRGLGLIPIRDPVHTERAGRDCRGQGPPLDGLTIPEDKAAGIKTLGHAVEHIKDHEQVKGAFEILRVSSAQISASLKFCAFG